MNEIGLIGLGVMGKSLVENMANKGFKVSVYNKTKSKIRDFIDKKNNNQKIYGFYDLEGFVQSLERPRKIILMIKAGEPVDIMIEHLKPLLESGDLLIDGGNTNYNDTNRRIDGLRESSLLYLGMGISGGEEGALKGPSLMPGGSREAYELVEDILLKISAKTESGPCCSYIGEGSAGHFVKMVHNGIEYGMMEAIAEAYQILRKVLNLSSQEIGDIFKRWNKGVLNSYLMEISSKIMAYKDVDTGEILVENILDKAGQKGTGKWTTEAALNLGIPGPSLSSSLEARVLSFFKDKRIKLSKLYKKETPSLTIDKEKLIGDLEKTLIFSYFILFSQGLWLIDEASKEYNYGINLSEVLRVWKGGCIIRAKLLDLFRGIIMKDRENTNLLDGEVTRDFLMDKINSIKNITNIAKEYYIAVPAFNSGLDYLFSMIEENLPANIIQGQRDFFGAHGYERIDKDGLFHSQWE